MKESPIYPRNRLNPSSRCWSPFLISLFLSLAFSVLTLNVSLVSRERSQGFEMRVLSGIFSIQIRAPPLRAITKLGLRSTVGVQAQFHKGPNNHLGFL